MAEECWSITKIPAFILKVVTFLAWYFSGLVSSKSAEVLLLVSSFALKLKCN